MEILKFKDISLTYFTNSGETEALSDISFDVTEGEFAAIVGPSGCGKTTILSLISGLIKPKSGEIFVNGHSGSNSREVGYMLQRDQLFEWRTVEKNIMLGLEIQKINTAANRAYAHSLLKKYGLDAFRKHFPNQLSGGMRQRAALIRTLAFRPQILLLDEPFSALDYQTRITVCDDVFKIIRTENKTALLVSHDIGEAVSMANKVIVLTNRPAKIRSVYEIDIKGETPLKRRQDPKFSSYCEKIYEDVKN